MGISIVGKWALVTGASRGIGLQVARALALRGCNLVLHSRDVAHTSALAEALAAQVQVHQLSADLAVDEQVDRLAAEASSLSGGIDLLYNNAAIMTPYRSDYLQTPADDFRSSFAVNVIAPIRISNLLLSGMKQRRFGRIVQVTSGIKEQPELTAYATSKAALDKYVRDMAPSLRGTGVLMNLLDPGWLRTDLGGPDAPNAVESVLPGALVPALVDGEVHGMLFCAQDYVGRTL